MYDGGVGTGGSSAGAELLCLVIADMSMLSRARVCMARKIHVEIRTTADSVIRIHRGLAKRFKGFIFAIDKTMEKTEQEVALV